jgi:hypothetical protein
MITARHGKDAFFKYYTPQSAKLTLQNTSLKWSTPLLFNDPFDNQFELYFEDSSDLLVDRQLQRFLDAITSPEPFKPNQFGAQTPLMEFVRQKLIENPDFKFTGDELADVRDGVIEGMQRVHAITPVVNAEICKIMADTSIFCLSETHDNLLMWSHYAQNHTGAVIKFLVLPEAGSATVLAQPVRYSNKIPLLNFADLADFEKLRRDVYDVITLTKSDVWSYEKEWRMIASLRDKTQTYEILPCFPEEVGTVYLGCKMTSEDKTEISKIVCAKYPKAKIFQATRHPREFALVFEEII